MRSTFPIKSYTPRNKNRARLPISADIRFEKLKLPRGPIAFAVMAPAPFTLLLSTDFTAFKDEATVMDKNGKGWKGQITHPHSEGSDAFRIERKKSLLHFALPEEWEGTATVLDTWGTGAVVALDYHAKDFDLGSVQTSLFDA